MKKFFTIILVSMLILGCASCKDKEEPISNEKLVVGGTDNGAKKPSIMYNNTLYSISPDRADIFDVEEDDLECVGVIEDVISGASLPTENLQASRNDGMLGCNIYIAGTYPNHLFAFDKSGDFYVYVSEESGTVSDAADESGLINEEDDIVFFKGAAGINRGKRWKVL